MSRIAKNSSLAADPSLIGRKDDDLKTQPALIINDMPRALMAVAEVASFGALKYSKGNWLHVENGVERYTNAMDRHRIKEGVETHDGDSCLMHAAHTAWNALARLELMLRDHEEPKL